MRVIRTRATWAAMLAAGALSVGLAPGAQAANGPGEIGAGFEIEEATIADIQQAILSPEDHRDRGRQDAI